LPVEELCEEVFSLLLKIGINQQQQEPSIEKLAEEDTESDKAALLGMGT
jgi:hypothetical protein